MPAGRKPTDHQCPGIKTVSLGILMHPGKSPRDILDMLRVLNAGGRERVPPPVARAQSIGHGSHRDAFTGKGPRKLEIILAIAERPSAAMNPQDCRNDRLVGWNNQVETVLLIAKIFAIIISNVERFRNLLRRPKKRAQRRQACKRDRGENTFGECCSLFIRINR